MPPRHANPMAAATQPPSPERPPVGLVRKERAGLLRITMVSAPFLIDAHRMFDRRKIDETPDTKH
jgi:hypothetical protein